MDLKEKILIGIDIGGTNTAVGYLTIEGEYLYDESIETKASQNIDEFLKRLTEKINQTISERNYDLKGIGVAAPCGNYYTGKIESPSNFCWGNVDFVNKLQSLISVPVVITNDANAAAFGEMLFGKAKGLNNFIVLTLGTGLGSGIVLNGEILLGANGLAGEIGHTSVEQLGRRCSCGKFGCLETYVSANGLRRTAYYLISQYNFESELKNYAFNEITGKIINDLALKNDIIAVKTFEYTGEILGQALANMVKIFDLEAIILFGGLVEAGDLLLKPTKKHFEEFLLEMYKNKVKIEASAFNNGKTAILGSFALIKKHLERK